MDEQTAFWRKLYWNGLGEFFYTNGIAESQEAFLQVESGKRKVESKGIFEIRNSKSEIQNSYLVPIGGGKDSVVTLELLRRAGKTIRPLIMNPRGATVECARVGGFGMDEVLVIRRTIDPVLLELNAKGYLNGHTPFSAMPHSEHRFRVDSANPCTAGVLQDHILYGQPHTYVAKAPPKTVLVQRPDPSRLRRTYARHKLDCWKTPAKLSIGTI